MSSPKKPVSNRLKSTLNELDTAIEQWDSLTNKPLGEQAPIETKFQQKAKTLLKELREQIDEFESVSEDENTPPKSTSH